MATFDPQRIRLRFPSLSQEFNGHPAIFFDNPGGTQVAGSVIDAVGDYYMACNANIGGFFDTSERTTEVVRRAREAVAALLNAPTPDFIVFGPNMTSLTFHLARSFGETIRPGEEIVVTNLDHDANVMPWTDLQAQGAVIRVADIHPEDCTLDLDSFQRALTDRTKLVAITHASNAVGTVPPVRRLIKLAHDAGALAFVDAVQYAPHGPIDVQDLDCDFLACSAYKFFGPHVGALYGKPEHLERLTPHKVRPAKNTIPWRWETGTPNFEGLAGTTAAIEHLRGIGDLFGDNSDTTRLNAGMRAILDYEQALSARLLDGLQSVPGLRVYGITDKRRLSERLPTFSFTWDAMTPAETAAALADAGIACWAGNYYAVNVMERLGLQETGGAVRIGAVHYSTVGEIDRLVEKLHWLEGKRR